MSKAIIFDTETTGIRGKSKEMSVEICGAITYARNNLD